MVGKQRSAFTIVELLITFSILLILSAVLLPAVQSSREAARLASCRNNISQLSKAMVEFETFNGYFPSGGWSSQWLGVAERSSDSSQPGGWTYGVLPFIEEMGTRNLVAGVNSSNLATQYTKLATASLPTFSCPSRRGSQSLPVAATTPFQTANGSLVLSKATRSDFAVNSGAVGSCPDLSTFQTAITAAATGSKKSSKVTICHAPPGNPTNTQTLNIAISGLNGHQHHDDDRIGSCSSCDQPVDAIISHPASVAEGDKWRKMSAGEKFVNIGDMGIPDVQDGMAFRMSRLQAASVLDGLSNTYLVGEKNVDAATYSKGTDAGDSSPMMAGYSSNTVRWGSLPPARDTKGVSNPMAFGSAHQGGCNVSYADGMVRTVSFDIDPTVHAQLSCRDDGKGMPPK